MNKQVIVGIITIVVLALFPAVAKPPPEGEVAIGVSVNYGSAYRDGNWAPVDVLVTNNDRDFAGWIEATTISNTGERQSPIYRVSALSPKGSIKRFRLICYLEHTSRIEVKLYGKNRALVGNPAFADVGPIRNEDFLALVLAENPGDYSFMTSALQSGKTTRRIYRENLRNETLTALADYPQCYRQLDAVIIGDVDPSRISERHREILRKYVEEGGAIIVFTGANARNFQGTWVEELLGVRIGQQETISELELERTYFPNKETFEGVADRQVPFAPLTKVASHVKSMGKSEILATVNPINNGVAAAIALDSSGFAGKNGEQYAFVLREILAHRRKSTELNFNYAAKAGANNLPSIVGIQILSRNSAMLYLGLYIGFGIILNWLFFNFRKRRDLAWIAMIVFSGIFTAYAMVFGTSGTGRSSELEQIDVLRVPLEGRNARVYSLKGIFTTRTSHFSWPLNEDFALASDLSDLNMYGGYRRRQDADTSQEPFVLVENEPARAENIRVRASEIRFFRSDGYKALPGGIDGKLVQDVEGLHGNIVNNTGLDIQKPIIVYQGKFHVAETTHRGWQINVSASNLRHSVNSPASRSNQGQLDGFKWNFMANLFRAESIDSQRDYEYEDNVRASPAHGPYIVGWLTNNDLPTVGVSKSERKRIRETLVVADLAVERKRNSAPALIDVDVRNSLGGRNSFRSTLGRPTNQDWKYRASTIYQDQKANIEIGTQGINPKSVSKAMVIDLYWSAPVNVIVEFSPVCGGGLALTESSIVEQVAEKIQGLEFQRTTYNIPDWHSCLNPETPNIMGTVKLTYGPEYKGNRRGVQATFSMTAHLQSVSEPSGSEELPLWR